MKKTEEKTASPEGGAQAEDGDDGGAGATSTPPITTTAVASVPAATAAPTKIETKPRGEEACTRRSRDGTWTKKNDRSYFGYKLHTKDDLSTAFISAFEVTTASVNDNSIDLTKKGEPCVRDRGYTDPGRGYCLSMIRAKAGKPLTEKDREMNRFISKIRAPVEHPLQSSRGYSTVAESS
ncbi:MAG: transposase [Thaumarchaeota archaeon]|nr:transposase [Nitrososphaerota archaeon]